jgi:TolB-like protein
MRSPPLIATIAALVLMLGGCSRQLVAHEDYNPLIAASYHAADALIDSQRKEGLAQPARKMLVATLVDLNQLDRSSPFGRLVAEQLASRLVQLGVGVSELKLHGSLFMREREGEMVLAREVRDIGLAQNAETVLVGTYVDGGSKVYVTLKIVRVADGIVVAAHNFAVEKVGSVETLTRTDR